VDPVHGGTDGTRLFSGMIDAVEAAALERA
jgi:hypothetical protein